ncbi:MAG: hypothetical protein ACXVEF_29615 [Polyangiales bacterium]
MKLAGLVLCAFTAANVGCYAHWDVPHRELPKLDGYKAPASVQLKDTRGKEVAFDDDTEIMVYDGKRERSVTLSSATVSGGAVYGVVAWPGEGVLQLPLRPDGVVRLKRYSWGRTLVFSVVIPAGAVVMLIVALSSFKSPHP